MFVKENGPGGGTGTALSPVTVVMVGVNIIVTPDGDKLTRGLKDVLEIGNRVLELVSPAAEKTLKRTLEEMGGQKFLEWLELSGVASQLEMKELLQGEPGVVALAATERGQAAIQAWKERHRAEIGRGRRIIKSLVEICQLGASKAIVKSRLEPQGVADRRTGRVLLNRMGQALRHLDDRWALSRSPLARLDGAEKLAREKYRGRVMPRGLALRDLLRQCVEDAIKEADNDPRLHRACQYLILAAKGLTCTEISRELHLSREHTSRTCRRRALELVADRLSSLLGALA